MNTKKNLFAKVFLVIAFILIVMIGFLGSRKKGEELITGDIPTIDKNIPKETKTATFSMGCFWGPDALFGSEDGVVRTRVGYAGGSKNDPTYHDLGDHTETIQIEFDPGVITYGDLLEMFWNNHDPTRYSSTQYRSMIFFHDNEQKELAFESKDQLDYNVNTIIRKYSEFYPAEDYHQKYRLTMNKPLHQAFMSIYPNQDDFVGSTAVARANGYVSGHGQLKSEEDLERIGLNRDGREFMYKIWKRARGV